MCHNGWGRQFGSVYDLLATIDAELRATAVREQWHNGDADKEAVRWMRGSNHSYEEIAEVLNISVGRVQGICRSLGMEEVDV